MKAKKKKVESPKVITLSEAQKIIKDQVIKDETDCMREIAQACRKYNCIIDARIKLSISGQIIEVNAGDLVNGKVIIRTRSAK